MKGVCDCSFSREPQGLIRGSGLHGDVSDTIRQALDFGNPSRANIVSVSKQLQILGLGLEFRGHISAPKPKFGTTPLALANTSGCAVLGFFGFRHAHVRLKLGGSLLLAVLEVIREILAKESDQGGFPPFGSSSWLHTVSKAADAGDLMRSFVQGAISEPTSSKPNKLRFTKPLDRLMRGVKGLTSLAPSHKTFCHLFAVI